MTTIVPVILAGGSGSRLWPLSREHYPKQMLALENEYSLLQNTLNRFPSDLLEHLLVITNESYRHMVAHQIHQMGAAGHILLEPTGRNTAPAIALAALFAQQISPDAVLVVMPADHIIHGKTQFHTALEQAVSLAEKNDLVTFGIKPTHPATGYGYILSGEALTENAHRIEQFAEKPTEELAKKYVDSGQYYWNSGMFVFKASVYLEELNTAASDIYEASKAIFAHKRSSDCFYYFREADFNACRSESIDYAVMEQTKRAAVVPLDVGWNDIGSWESLYDLAKKDTQGNVIQGDVVTEKTTDSFLKSTHRLLTTVGMARCIVIETPDAVLVANRDNAEDIKKLVLTLKHTARKETRETLHNAYDWGISEILCQHPTYQLAQLTIKPQQTNVSPGSTDKTQQWIVLSGHVLFVFPDKTQTLNQGDTLHAPANADYTLSSQDEAVTLLKLD
jgi:mannose-1-phosphate guanylyltransferase/mannose-6-phosphate isomerase